MTRWEWLRPADPTSRQVLGVHTDTWLDTRVEAPVLCGLAANPAAPVGLLLELLASRPEAVPGAFRRRVLPAAVVEAMRRHPTPRVRGALAANPFVDPHVRVLLADDPNAEVVALVRVDRRLPDVFGPRELDELRRFHARGLMSVPELTREIGEWVARGGRERFGTALRHPEPVIRMALAGVFQFPNHEPGDDALQALTRDDSAEVRAAAARVVAELTALHGREMERADLWGTGYRTRYILSSQPLSHRLVDDLIAEGDTRSLVELVINPSVPNGTAARLITHPDPEVRQRLAQRPDLTAEQLARLAADPDIAVRTRVSVHPGLSEEQRAVIDIDVSDSQYHGLDRDSPTGPPIEQTAAWARSVNPLLRRRAAEDPRLPIALLSADDDPGVRVRLAHHHPDAPPATLVWAFRERTHDRGRLPLLPNFPPVRLPDDPDPAVRALIAQDPGAPPGLVERLVEDADPAVRRAMAACPRLPVGRIAGLLEHPELAEAAASNPALPEDRMRELIRLSARS